MDNWQGLRNTVLSYLKGNPGWQSFGLVCFKTGIPIEIIQAIADADLSMFDVSKNGKVLKLKHEWFAPPSSPSAEATEAVLEYAAQLHPQVFDVVAVRSQQKVLDRYVHLIELDRQDDDHVIAEDTPADWKSSDGLSSWGKVVGFDRDDHCCYVALTSPVSSADLPAKLRVDTGFPSKQLAQLLGTLQCVPDRFSQLAVPSCVFDHQDSRKVATWLAARPTPWSHALWGPPGSGKTFAVAHLCIALLAAENNGRVLFVAASNVATDTATAQFVEVLRKTGMHQFLQDHNVFRFGYPRLSAVLQNGDLFGPPELKALADEIASSYRILRSIAPDEHSKKAELKTAIDQLQKKLRDALGGVIASSRVVFTTITNAVQPDGPITGCSPFDTVIADEASMIGGATLMAISSLANRRFLVAGDPKQLGPVVRWSKGPEPPASVQHWLEKDAFQFASTAWVRILEQRRCHPDIWSLVSELYPGISTAPEAATRLEQASGLAPFPNTATALLDVSSGKAPVADFTEIPDDESLVCSYECACVRSARSWKNPPTAALAVQLARDLQAQRKNISVAIITPYRAQARLIKKWLQEETKHGSAAGTIEVGTVHSFQGGEADAVILDIVDGPPKSKFGKLLTGDTARRLLNVAITRARSKLIIVAHKEWVRLKSSKEGNLYTVLFSGQMKAASVEVHPFSPKDSGAPESPIEEMLYSALLTVKEALPPLELQYRIYDENKRIVTRADFAFPTIKLAVYCHGAAFHLNAKQWQKDLHQVNELVRLGWKVNAFSGWQINDDVTSCVEQIKRTVASLCSSAIGRPERI